MHFKRYFEPFVVRYCDEWDCRREFRDAFSPAVWGSKDGKCDPAFLDGKR